MKQPVNVYGETQYWVNGELETITSGFGFKNSKGNITWYNGYVHGKDENISIFEEKYYDGDYTTSSIISYGNGCDLSELI